MRGRKWLVVCLFFATAAAGCGRGVFLQDDGFSQSLPQECSSRWECTALLETARRREATCEPNTVGKVRCDEARADLHAVERMKQRFDDRDAERLELAAERDRAEAERQEAERARTEEEALREEEERRAQEVRLAEQAAENARLDFYRPMTLQLRIQRLVRCQEDGAESRQDLGVSRNCDTLLVDLLAVTDDDGDKQALVRANEEAIDATRRAQEAEQKREEAQREAQARQDNRRASGPSKSQGGTRTSGGDRLRCCDGTLSPSCMCGGSRRGCCSHHGGVCGCE